MHKSLRHLVLLLVMAPSMVLAQQAAPAPCPTPQVRVLTAQVLALVDEQPQVVAYTLKSPALAEPGFDAEMRKTFEKVYKVSSADMLNIENKFGKVHVNTWNKNEIQVRVDIICRAGSEQRAQEMLDKISIRESRTGSSISVKTEMQSMTISGNSKTGFEINYTINMPESNPLTISNSFGDVYLAAFKGKTNIAVKYGSLKTERLGNVANTIKLAYGSGSCGYMNGGSVDVSYGSLNLDGTNDIQGSSRYSDFRIGNLDQALSMQIKYGSLRVDNISKNMQKINLESGFSPITLGFDQNTAFNFDVNVHFSSFKFDQDVVNVTSLQRNGHTSSEYKGKFGTSSPKASVSIVSKYGDVKFTN
ncbi:hypothetical protein [Pontibacter sp. SGAir0037]|uniref:hypothetical protein n=1 Tax=Pontibacter sp. SGAir0037 TaxID=2571030 RepID=UPI001F0D6849|nr:hypothetical protein [Pontibacter sp. SGAir0037]